MPVAVLEKMKPARLAVYVHKGEPKLHVVALLGTGAGEAMPKITLPALDTCTSMVTLLLPNAMANTPLPPAQFTAGVPVAFNVPPTPLV